MKSSKKLSCGEYYYTMYEMPFEIVDKEKILSPDCITDYTDINRNRYNTYFAKINGRDENKNEIRTYYKVTDKHLFINDWKTGDIIKFNKWDTRKKRNECEYFLIVKINKKHLLAVFQSTYLKCCKLKQQIKEGIYKIEDDEK